MRSVLEEAGTHRSANSHAVTVFGSRDLDLLTPKQMIFLRERGLTFLSSLVILARLAASVFETSREKQTDKRRCKPYPASRNRLDTPPVSVVLS